MSDQLNASGVAHELREAMFSQNEPRWRKGLRALIRLKLRELGPMTNRELANSCQLPETDIAPRMSELVELHEIRDSGRRKSSLSGKGRKQVVWEATVS